MTGWFLGLGLVSWGRMDCVNGDHHHHTPNPFPRNQPQPQKPAPESVERMITYDDFAAVDIRVGTVVRAEPFPEARKPSIKLWIDFGPELGERKTSAGIAVHYEPEQLVGRQVCAVVNFPPRQIGKFMSEVLTLGFPDADGETVLIAPDRSVPNGGKLY